MPTVGSIVHYSSYGSPGGEFPAAACRAAIVTEVGDNSIGLAVYNPTGMWFNRDVKESAASGNPCHGAPGTWHWPTKEGGC